MLRIDLPCDEYFIVVYMKNVNINPITTIPIKSIATTTARLPHLRHVSPDPRANPIRQEWHKRSWYPSAHDSLLEAMQAEKARTMELDNLASERAKPRKLPSLEVSPRLATSPSFEISSTRAADGHTQALVAEPVDASTKELGLADVDGFNNKTESAAADALQMGGKVPLPPLVAQREQPELPDELASVESVEQAKLQPGRLAPLPSAATASANAIHTGSPPMWRKAPKEALEPIGR